jgi:hypothetical protein
MGERRQAWTSRLLVPRAKRQSARPLRLGRLSSDGGFLGRAAGFLGRKEGYHHGRGLDTSGLARLLGESDVKPRTIRVCGGRRYIRNAGANVETSRLTSGLRSTEDDRLSGLLLSNDCPSAQWLPDSEWAAERERKANACRALLAVADGLHNRKPRCSPLRVADVGRLQVHGRKQ